MWYQNLLGNHSLFSSHPNPTSKIKTHTEKDICNKTLGRIPTRCTINAECGGWIKLGRETSTNFFSFWNVGQIDPHTWSERCSALNCMPHWYSYTHLQLFSKKAEVGNSLSWKPLVYINCREYLSVFPNPLLPNIFEFITQQPLDKEGEGWKL